MRVRGAVLEPLVRCRADPPVRSARCRRGGSRGDASTCGNGSSEAGGPPRFLTIATLTPTKDQLTLVRALAQEADLPWTGALVGSDRTDPDYAARLRAEIAAAGLEERITVPGALIGQALDQSGMRPTCWCCRPGRRRTAWSSSRRWLAESQQ